MYAHTHAYMHIFQYKTKGNFFTVLLQLLRSLEKIEQDINKVEKGY